jgi:hypothetical protein
MKHLDICDPLLFHGELQRFFSVKQILCLVVIVNQEFILKNINSTIKAVEIPNPAYSDWHMSQMYPCGSSKPSPLTYVAR